MALRKAFPTERNYDFWNILLCFLVQQDDRATEKERTLFGTLAYRLVSKAAEAAPTDSVCLTAEAWSWVAIRRVLIVS
jgi:N-terminal acetyltransferase B complex non-catalytic subunit